ncbi:hypothetical protein KCU83_g3505, partial [Aureobasidium melanogenum]
MDSRRKQSSAINLAINNPDDHSKARLVNVEIKKKMCGYHELQTPCCGEKTGFSPSPDHKCTYYFTNNRYCRTGSVRSWILASPPLTTRTKCENCKKTDDHEQAILQAEIKKREKQEEKERAEQEERRQQEQARELRLREKELKRVRDERKDGSAVDALRSQMAGLGIKNGRDIPRSEGSTHKRSGSMDDVD